MIRPVNIPPLHQQFNHIVELDKINKNLFEDATLILLPFYVQTHSKNWSTDFCISPFLHAQGYIHLTHCEPIQPLTRQWNSPFIDSHRPSKRDEPNYPRYISIRKDPQLQCDEYLSEDTQPTTTSLNINQDFHQKPLIPPSLFRQSPMLTPDPFLSDMRERTPPPFIHFDPTDQEWDEILEHFAY